MDYNQYFKDLVTAANSGDEDAILELRNAYYGHRDELQTFDEDLIAFYQDNKKKPYSTYYYGRMNILGTGVPADVLQGIKLLLRARKMGCVDATLALAKFAEAGLYTAESYEDLQKEAEQTPNFMTFCYKATNALEKDDDADYVKYMKKSIKLGNKNGWTQLGIYYSEKGLEDKANECLDKGMKINDPQAYYTRATLYRNDIHGDTNANNEAKIVELFEKAAKMDDKDAIHALADFYVEKDDYDSAKKYAKRGIKLRHLRCYYLLGQIYLAKEKKVTAVINFLKGAQKKNQDCLLKLLKMGIVPNLDPTDKEAVKTAIDHPVDFGDLLALTIMMGSGMANS